MIPKVKKQKKSVDSATNGNSKKKRSGKADKLSRAKDAEDLHNRSLPAFVGSTTQKHTPMKLSASFVAPMGALEALSSSSSSDDDNYEGTKDINKNVKDSVATPNQSKALTPKKSQKRSKTKLDTPKSGDNKTGISETVLVTKVQSPLTSVKKVKSPQKRKLADYIPVPDKSSTPGKKARRSIATETTVMSPLTVSKEKSKEIKSPTRNNGKAPPEKTSPSKNTSLSKPTKSEVTPASYRELHAISDSDSDSDDYVDLDEPNKTVTTIPAVENQEINDSDTGDSNSSSSSSDSESEDETPGGSPEVSVAASSSNVKQGTPTQKKKAETTPTVTQDTYGEAGMSSSSDDSDAEEEREMQADQLPHLARPPQLKYSRPDMASVALPFSGQLCVEDLKGDQELWLVQVPSQFSVSSLDGKKMVLRSKSTPIAGVDGWHTFALPNSSKQHQGAPCVMLPSRVKGGLQPVSALSGQVSVVQRMKAEPYLIPPVRPKPTPALPSGLKMRNQYVPPDKITCNSVQQVVHQAPKKKKKKEKKHKNREVSTSHDPAPIEVQSVGGSIDVASAKEKPKKKKKKSKESDGVPVESKHSNTNESNTKSLTCHFCEKTFLKKHHLEDHVRIHTGERIFSCSLCGDTFIQQSNYKKHMARHTGVRDYQCHHPQCGKTFSTQRNVKRHCRTHNVEEIFYCKGCRGCFTNLDDRCEHLKSGVYKNKPRTLKCELCKKAYCDLNGLTIHMFVTHGQDSVPDLKNQLLKRDETNNYNTKRVETNKDIEDVSTMEKALQGTVKPDESMYCEKDEELVCGICGKSFSNKSSLGQHVKCHNEERSYTCDVCDKQFLYQDHLSFHMVRHTGVKEYLCAHPDCGMKFTQSSSLKAHCKRHDVPEISYCQLCRICFTDKTDICEHIKTGAYKNKRREKKYKCGVCKKSYNDQGSLLGHMQAKRHGDVSQAITQ